jgi:hypothetical protein
MVIKYFDLSLERLRTRARPARDGGTIRTRQVLFVRMDTCLRRLIDAFARGLAAQVAPLRSGPHRVRVLSTRAVPPAAHVPVSIGPCVSERAKLERHCRQGSQLEFLP